MTSVCVLLTATIEPKGIPFVARTDPKLRLEDHKKALHLWLADPSVSRLVLCENSGADITELRTIAEEFSQRDKSVEIISFDGQSSFSGSRGKGFGEMLTLSYMLDNSKALKDAKTFIKVSGRYYIKNVDSLIRYIDNNRAIDVVCGLTRNLSLADSRCFGGSTSFMRQYLLPMQEHINDWEGVYFEHVLARAIHKAMADGNKWSLPPYALDVIGVSGTYNATYKSTWITRTKRQLYHKVKKFVYRR